MRSDPEQVPLPFGEAEGAFNERKSLLGMALLKVRADLHLAQFVLWVFNTTAGGLEGRLVKSYDELASPPWGLCCGRTKARETVDRARQLGLVAWDEARTASGARCPNEYYIDWEGVRNATGLAGVLGAASRHGDAAGRQGDAASRHGGAATRPLSKEYTFPTPTDSEAETEAEEPLPRKAANFDSKGTPRTGSQSGPEPRQAERWFGEVPELREAAGRRIVPLPPAGLVYGAFKPLKETNLADGSLVAWYRRQIGLSRPLTGDTEADLLLVLAAGIAASKIPDREVLKSRVGIFSATVSRGAWSKVLFCVPAARELLDHVASLRPDCLTDPAGMGRAANFQPEESLP
jgi:hypothetical protein